MLKRKRNEAKRKRLSDFAELKEQRRQTEDQPKTKSIHTHTPDTHTSPRTSSEVKLRLIVFSA